MAAVVKQSYWKRTLGGFFGNGNANLKADSEQDWSSFHHVTVTYAFGKRLTFSGLKRYLTIGQLRELVAAQLLLPADFVGLQCEGEQLLINSMARRCNAGSHLTDDVLFPAWLKALSLLDLMGLFGSFGEAPIFHVVHPVAVV